MFSATRHGPVLALLLSGCATPPPPVEVKDIDFKAELARKGEWIVVAPYGKVWHPNATVVGPDFVPYLSGGGWVYGQTGWTFESKWPFGKFIFHYGRWFVADDLGWLWLPDQVWGPAWVEWRGGDGHVGWSPIPPEVRGARTQPPAWYYLKTKHLSARQAVDFRLKLDDVTRVHPRAEPLPLTGPNPEQIRAEGGMDRDPVPLDSIPAVIEAPPPPVEVQPEPPPPPPPVKKKKKGKRR